MHVADAVAVDKLIKALSAQTQLEAVEVIFAELILPSPDDIDVPSDFDSDEDPDPYHALEAENAEYRRTSAITTRMFAPAILSLCTFVEDSNKFRLRCDTA